MNDYIAFELARARHADLIREADEYRRAALARPARPAPVKVRASSRAARLVGRVVFRRNPAYR